MTLHQRWCSTYQLCLPTLRVPLTSLLTHSFTQSLTCLLTHSIIRTFIHSLIIHSLLSHSLTHQYPSHYSRILNTYPTIQPCLLHNHCLSNTEFSIINSSSTSLPDYLCLTDIASSDFHSSTQSTNRSRSHSHQHVATNFRASQPLDCSVFSPALTATNFRTSTTVALTLESAVPYSGDSTILHLQSLPQSASQLL